MTKRWKPETTDDVRAYAPKLKPDRGDSEIPDDTVVMRYIDVKRAVDLFDTSTLYFRRADLLRELDPLEGTVAPKNTLGLDRSDPAAQQTLLRYKFIEDCPVAQTFVNCWYLGSSEKSEMFREFAGSGGIAIWSTIGRMRDLCDGPSGMKVAVIKRPEYIWYSVDRMDDRDDHFPLHYKSDCFRHHNEVRFMVQYLAYYQTMPEYERVNVRLTSFVTKVAIAPGTTKDDEAAILRSVPAEVADAVEISRVIEK